MLRAGEQEGCYKAWSAGLGAAVVTCMRGPLTSITERKEAPMTHPTLLQELLAVNGCWGKRNCFLQWKIMLMFH